MRQLQQILQQQKEHEEDCVNRIGKLQDEKRVLQDRVASLQKALAQAEQNKRELERAQIRVEKDKKALKTTLEKVMTGNIYQLQKTFVNIRELFISLQYYFVTESEILQKLWQLFIQN